MTLPTPYYQDDAVTLYHGRAEDILPELDPVDAVITDPPYNEVNRPDAGLRNLDRGEADSVPVDTGWLSAELARLAPTVYITCATEQVSPLRAGLVAAGMSTRLGIWHKTNPSPMNGEHLWLSAVEAVVFGRRKGAKFHQFCSAPVWTGPSEPRDDHPTAKPEWLFKAFALASTDPGDTILDPYAGSGTTLRVAKDLGLKAIGIEQNAGYCDVIVDRLAQGVLDLFGSAQ